MKTFYKWLLLQGYRRDPVGDLARDMIDDRELPIHKTKNSLLNHIINCDGCDDAITAFHRAWSEYKNFRRLTKQ